MVAEREAAGDQEVVANLRQLLKHDASAGMVLLLAPDSKHSSCACCPVYA